MREKILVTLVILAILLAACTTTTSLPTSVVTGNPVEPAPSLPVPTPYPEPYTEIPGPVPSYPEPGTPRVVTPGIPPSGYEPQPGDSKLQRDKVTLELENSSIFIKPSDPTQAEAILSGYMSDPCHELRVVVMPPDASKTIDLDVYTVFDTSIACITVIKPFDVTIPLGSYISGEYTVMVNGEELGTFFGGDGVQPGDESLSTGKVTIDMENSQLLISDTLPRLATVILQGELPTPCHQLRVVMESANTENRINLNVYSVYDPQVICNDMTRPFHITYPLGSFSSGHYNVYINGQLLGEFDG
jgi:hypothetical protein